MIRSNLAQPTATRCVQMGVTIQTYDVLPSLIKPQPFQAILNICDCNKLNSRTYEAAESTPVPPRRLSFKYHSDAANTSLLARAILPFPVEMQLVRLLGTLSGERSRIISKEM